MKVISISTDRNIFDEKSSVRARQIEYGGLFDELHIVVFTKRFSRLTRQVQIAPNVWVYGTASLTKFQYMRDAGRIAADIFTGRGFAATDTIVSVQDPFETGLVGTTLKKKFGMPLHVQVHTDFLSPYFAEESMLNKLRVRMAKKVLAEADAVRVVSKRIAESFRSIHLQDGVVPEVLPIFVDVSKIENASPLFDLKKKYPQFNFIILMASRLAREKNITFALSVFEKLREEYPKIGLVIVGSGPEKRRLTAAAKKLGIRESVVFEEWQQNLSSYYKTANLFLVTSKYEGYGMTLIEAVASGCPTVSSDVGIAPDLLRGSGESFVCPVDDMGSFFNAISKLIDDTGVRETLVHEAQNRLGGVTYANNAEYLERYKANILAATQVKRGAILAQ